MTINNLNNLKHKLEILADSITASPAHPDSDHTILFNFNANLTIGKQLFPVRVQGLVGDLFSFDEHDYGEVIGYGADLRELVPTDNCERFHKKPSALFRIASDLLRQPHVLELIKNQQHKPFVPILT